MGTSDLWESARSWYSNSKGVQNLRTYFETDYKDISVETRTKYQIDRYERLKFSTIILGGGAGLLAGINGNILGGQQYHQVKQLAIYESKSIMINNWFYFRFFAALGYGLPVFLRTSLYATFLLGVPALLGVYHNDTDHVSHYACSGAVGAVLTASLRTGTELRTARVKLVAGVYGMLVGVVVGFNSVLIQYYDIYPFCDAFVARRKKVDPFWMDYVEKQAAEKLSVEEQSIEKLSLEEQSVELEEQAVEKLAV